ncbi:MAG TPA: IS5 family transposase [Rhodothermia bacterium]|nr:IS5 family transposase [Rhodothermia bacterium]
MRGSDVHQEGLFSYVSPEGRIPKSHPLRKVRTMVDAALAQMSGHFEQAYSEIGRSSVAPEKLIRALLLQIFYSIRSERLLCEQLDYNLLFRWFVGLSMDDRIWDHSTFSKNRDRLMQANIAQEFFEQVLAEAKANGLASDEHFTVDGTLIEAWASLKSFRARDGSDDPPERGGRNADRDFHGERRKNDTHASTTDPEAMLFRKGSGKEAKLCFMGHLVSENRNGLAVVAQLSAATGTAERDSALEMVTEIPGTQRITLGADKNYDTGDFVEDLRALRVTPHVAQNDTNRRSAIDGRTTRHSGYEVSQRFRKRIEEVFGWAKSIGPVRKTKFRGRERVSFQWVMTLAGYNLVRMRNLLAESPG